MERPFLSKDQSQFVDHDAVSSLPQPDRIVAFYKSLAGKSFNDVRNVLVNDFERFSPESQSDFILCVRSRNDYGQLELLKYFGIKYDNFAFNEYGTYLIPPLGRSGDIETGEGCTYLVSTPDWKHTLEQLRKGKFGHATVMLPELIITAGTPAESISEMEEISAIRVREAKLISEENPNATFIVGTLHFQTNNDNLYRKDDEKPFNAAYVLQNGKRRLVVTKQFQYSYAEYFKFHDLIEHRKASRIDLDSAILISSDLLGIINNPEYLDKNIHTLLVIGIFGVPTNTRNVPQDPDQATQYFLGKQKELCESVFEAEPNLNWILIVDRASHSDHAKKGYHANKPLNSVRFNPSGIIVR